MANDELGSEADRLEALLVPERCLSCGGGPRWESLRDHWGERWLAVCDCGRIETFFPDRRQRTGPRDPLALFLQGHLAPRRPATPAWVRLFLHSLQGEQATHWRHSPDPCEQCAARTVFGLLAWPHPSTAGPLHCLFELRLHRQLLLGQAARNERAAACRLELGACLRRRQATPRLRPREQTASGREWGGDRSVIAPTPTNPDQRLG